MSGHLAQCNTYGRFQPCVRIIYTDGLTCDRALQIERRHRGYWRNPLTILNERALVWLVQYPRNELSLGQFPSTCEVLHSVV